MSDNHLLNIVDEEGNIIGTEDRTVIHQNGLLHKIVHVWFYTPAAEIIFQIRGKGAETYPNLLDATAGGHVEIGQDYLGAAIAEAEEETGIRIAPQDLQFITMRKSGPSKDLSTATLNHHLAGVFAYLFKGDVSALRAGSNEDDGIRFESLPIRELFNLTEEQKNRFIPSQLQDDYMEIFKKIGSL